VTSNPACLCNIGECMNRQQSLDAPQIVKVFVVESSVVCGLNRHLIRIVCSRYAETTGNPEPP